MAGASIAGGVAFLASLGVGSVLLWNERPRNQQTADGRAHSAQSGEGTAVAKATASGSESRHEHVKWAKRKSTSTMVARTS